ncbi:MAG: hypothetical protein IPL89_07005 [Acidobacteria bacterium]|nr:hypothetical protein [Acidobacteriota bacterium]
MDPIAAARTFLPFWLPLLPLLVLPFAFLAGWLARKRTRFAAVMVSSVAGALVAHLAGPLSLVGPGVAGFLGGTAAFAGYGLGRRRAPPTPPESIARRAASLGAALLVLVAVEVGRPRVMPVLSRRSPLAAVALTGGGAGPLSDLASDRAAGEKPAAAVAFYRAAFMLDGRPGHLANAAFVENRLARCAEARALADEAGRAAQRPGVSELDRHLATRAAAVAARCAAASAADEKPD